MKEILENIDQTILENRAKDKFKCKDKRERTFDTLFG